MIRAGFMAGPIQYVRCHLLLFVPEVLTKVASVVLPLSVTVVLSLCNAYEVPDMQYVYNCVYTNE